MNKKDLLLLFDRPKEPIFIPKGDKDSQFEVPNTLVSNRFKDVATVVASRFNSKNTVTVNDISAPNLGEVETGLTRYENFTLFIPKHRKLAGKLIQLFMGVNDVNDLMSTAIYARERVNPYLFNYAFSVALLHRPDTKDLDIPSFVTSFPDKFVDGTILQKGREELSIVPENARLPIIIPQDYTGTDADPEHRLAYFREDMGINLHHWHWHLVYPFDGPDQIVRKDRRGELFYYMHQQIMARYNFERLCNQLSRVERLIELRAPIKEAYFPKLDSLVSSRGWPARVANQSLQNISRRADQLYGDIDDLERWRQRIFESIHSTSYRSADNQTVQFGENDGIDILGNMIEAAALLSPNTNYYGNMHNMGHVFLGFIHDPDGRHLEQTGVIGDSATAMRDPIFYRWHAYVDDIFQEHKSTLPAYTNPQLNYQGVQVDGVSLEVPGGRNNELSTFWMQSDVNLSRGMDFAPRGSVFARFTHLNHRPYNYNIQVTNNGPQRMGTCRIFLAPKLDESGRSWLLRDQRLLMTELDRFTVALRQGANTITRRSDESTITIPFNRTFRDLDTGRPPANPDGTPSTSDEAQQFNLCGCGWPHHMLVPKGTPDGFQCELFVMISNYEDDRVEQSIEGQCNDASSFCGIKDRLYPDRRPMGFPFDRLPAAGVDTLSQFLMPNMRVQDVTIRFNNQVVQNPRNRVNFISRAEGLALASLLTVQSHSVLERFNGIVVNIVEALNDITKTDENGVSVDSLVLSGGLSPSQFQDEVDYETEHDLRKRQLIMSDPVHNIVLREYMQSQVNSLKSQVGEIHFEQLVQIIESDYLAQLREYITL